LLTSIIQGFLISGLSSLILLTIGVQTSSNNNEAFAQISGVNSTNADNDDSPDLPLRASTALGNYVVELSWDPNSPLWIGNETTFNVQFLDKHGNPLTSAVNYDFTITSSDLSPIYELNDQMTDDRGVAKPITVTFENPGPIEIMVWANPSGTNETTDVQSESATFDVVVAPEFPPIMIISFIGGTLAIVVIMSRARWQWQSSSNR
jgi:hypothetical protein